MRLIAGGAVGYYIGRCIYNDIASDAGWVWVSMGVFAIIYLTVELERVSTR